MDARVTFVVVDTTAPRPTIRATNNISPHIAPSRRRRRDVDDANARRATILARRSQSPTPHPSSRAVRDPRARERTPRRTTRRRETYAFFLPPFLPLDIRLFLPTAMTIYRASVKGGRERSRARVDDDAVCPTRVCSVCSVSLRYRIVYVPRVLYYTCLYRTSVLYRYVRHWVS